jgi:hypothetical protein
MAADYPFEKYKKTGSAQRAAGLDLPFASNSQEGNPSALFQFQQSPLRRV